ncbi:MAG: DNA-binding protein WhiA [Evtepia sp.]|uniref:DNA-binding protein WhiA n=1 Tax=Evtepia sp. TaxID=2773933 RepID=UPI002A7542F0|nr:DNA-binding protein WhiA [Evtepia sp.]MDY3015348.1 DNA-binding protein WhiA [Evtepia sp.]
MSFSGDVKAELCRPKLSRKCCAQAEACGVLLYCNRFSPQEVRIVTESPAFAQRLSPLFYKAFGLSFDEKGDPDAPGKRIFTVTNPQKLAQLWDTCAFDPTGPAHHINFGLLEEKHCQLSFLRGAFLAGGSVTDPQKGYHLELATSHFRVSRELTALLLDLGYTPKETTRKANYITYFKQSEAIEELLTAIGAPVSAMELMNAKAEKLLRNGVNRRVNCEAANVDKTVDAAMEQRRAIQALRQAGVLEDLSPKLQEAAALREAHPELSLAQLAPLCQPPVTKSSLSHRLRKLIQLSQSLDQEP